MLGRCGIFQVPCADDDIVGLDAGGSARIPVSDGSAVPGYGILGIALWDFGLGFLEPDS